MTQYTKAEAEEKVKQLMKQDETQTIQQMQEKQSALHFLSLVRRDQFLDAVFAEEFGRAEVKLKAFNLTQTALSLMNQSIARYGDMLAAKAKREQDEKKIADGDPTPTATSPAEAEAQNEAAKLRIVKSDEGAQEEGSGETA